MSAVVDIRLPRGVHRGTTLPQRADIETLTYRTGWVEFDRIIRFFPGQVVVSTGIPGHGKSTMWFNVLLQLWKREGKSVFMHVPENEYQLVGTLRRIWGDDEPGFQRFLAEGLFVQQQQPIQGDPLHDIHFMLEQAAKTHEQEAVSIVYIDPWNELERRLNKQQSLTDYVGEALMLIGDFARRNEITVVIVAHPTKACYSDGNRVPNPGDIEGSAHWFNKPDNILIVHRELEKQNAMKVISAKRRHIGTGQIGACFFNVDPSTGRVYAVGKIDD